MHRKKQKGHIENTPNSLKQSVTLRHGRDIFARYDLNSLFTTALSAVALQTHLSQRQCPVIFP